MSSLWRHPTFGPIACLPEALRSEKVWKHFYRASEHWERLCGQDIAAMRAEAETLVGLLRAEHDTLPALEEGPRRRVEALLKRHHDTGYSPAYQAELALPETRWTAEIDASQRRKALTPGAVFVVVQFDTVGWVVTAFRPHPPTRGVEWDEADIRRHAAWYFRRQTGMDTSDLVRATAEHLQQSASVPIDSPRALWWLASAVGYGRLLARHAEVQAALPEAERVLRLVRPQDLDALRCALDWEGCLRHFAAALKDPRPEEAEDALAASEELLAVAEVVGAGAQAEAFLADAEPLIAWMPAERVDVGRHAAARCAAFGAVKHPVPHLWEAVEDAVLGAAMRAMTPIVHPAARWIDVLLPAEPRWKRWQQQVTARTQDLSTTVADWVRACMEDLQVLALAPTLGGAEAPAASWEVRGRPAPNAHPFRAFVVDAEHPEGHEVSAQFTPSDGYLWQMDAHDVGVLIVLVAGQRPIPGEDLESVLASVDGREDVIVETRVLSPPR